MVTSTEAQGSDLEMETGWYTAMNVSTFPLPHTVSHASNFARDRSNLNIAFLHYRNNGDDNGRGNGNGNIGNNDGNDNGNANVGNRNGNHNGNANRGSGNGNKNGNRNRGDDNGGVNGNGNVS